MFKIKKFLLMVLSGFVFSNTFCSLSALRRVSILHKISSQPFNLSRKLTFFSVNPKNTRVFEITHRVYALIGIDIECYLENKELLEMLYVTHVILINQNNSSDIHQCKFFETKNTVISFILEKFNVFKSNSLQRSDIKKMMFDILAYQGINQNHFMILFGMYRKDVEQIFDGTGFVVESLLVQAFAEEHALRDFERLLLCIALKIGISSKELKDRIIELIDQSIDAPGSVEDVSRKIVHKLTAGKFV